MYIQGEAHKELQSDSTHTIDHIQKYFRQKFQCSEALKLHQRQLNFLKWNHVFFFDDIITNFETNSATYNTRSF